MPLLTCLYVGDLIRPPENPDVTRKYGVMSIPTLMLFKDGAEAARVVGARGKDALLKEIDPHLAA